MHTDEPEHPWLQTPAGVRGTRKKKKSKPFLNAMTARIGGQFTQVRTDRLHPNEVLNFRKHSPPAFTQPSSAAKSDCPIPPSIAAILEDPLESESTKDEYRRGSALFQAYFSQALGGIFRSDLDGVPNYRKPRQSSATKAKFRATVARDSKAIRNDVNVGNSYL